MLTIRDHILAGHYPTNDRGWSLVPTRAARVARIIAANGDDPHPLIGLGPGGSCICWMADGLFMGAGKMSELDLLPPLPRAAVAADLGITEEAA